MSDVYVFKFESSKPYTKSGMPYKIYSESLNDIYKFIQQHNFDPLTAKDAISVHDRGEIKSLDCYTLKPHIFRSNFRKDNFTVLTTDYILDIIIENLSSDLAQTLMFGEAIFRTDIELFKTIIDLMDHIKQVRILDFAFVDTDSTDLTKASLDMAKLAQELIALNKRYAQHIGCPSEDGPIMAIQDNLSMDLLNKQIAPITLEGYISGFTELMLDVFT